MPLNPEQPHPNIDSIIEADFPQVDPDRLSEPDGFQVIGRCAGPRFDRSRTTVSSGLSGVKTIFPRTEQTQFVLVLDTATSEQRVVRYDPERHGYWPDISDTGELPSLLQDQLEGFGESLTPDGQRFRNERKQGASRKSFLAAHRPKPRRQR